MTRTHAEAVRGEFDLELLKATRFFDPDWYLAHNPDVAAAKVDATLHYLRNGGAEGRDPGPNFSASKYLAKHQGDAEARTNPLLHFLRRGLAQLDHRKPADLPDALAAMGVSVPGARDRSDRIKREGYGPAAVFVTHNANVGGAPVVLASIANWFRQHTNYQVRIVSMAGGQWMGRLMEIAPTFVVGEVNVADDRVEERREALRQFIGGEPAFTFINSVAAGGYCKVDPYDAPRLAYLHEMPRIVELHREEMALLRGSVQHFLCDGAAVATALKQRYNVPTDMMSIRECFIDLPAPAEFASAEQKASLRAAMGWSPQTKVVMGCGIVHWRKQPEVFVRAAAAVKGDVRFVWIGGGQDTADARALADSLGVGHKVEFLGHRDDHRALLRCADVFALTSVEDPFPLVCLDAAAASTPSVIFREAGGMGAFVEPEEQPPAGLAVPLGDEPAFFTALQTLLDDEELRTRLARTALDRVRTRHSADHGCMEILKTVRTVAALPPLVSVVVPVYNSQDFLQERLDTISAQTFKDVEIVLRDDCSTDASLEILKDFVDRHPLARLEAATTNGGSVFRAWARCIEAATGELVWLAEADDACEPDFLHRMVNGFAVSGVRLAYGRSKPIDKLGRPTGDYRQSYLKKIAGTYWDESHCVPALQEINAALGRRNSIPNASGVVVRRSAALRAVPIIEDFTIAGDWAFYVAVIHGGRVAYVDEAVNYHRRHGATVTRSLEGSEAYFRELASVGALVRHLYRPHAARDAAFDDMLAAEAERFGVAGERGAGALPSGAPCDVTPGVLYGVGDLSGGGAQMFAARFCNGWVRDGAPAVLFTVGHQADHPAVRGALSPEVPLVTADEVAAVGLPQFLRDWGLDVVVTGHWWADTKVGQWYEAQAGPAGAAESAPWVIVMHGCYENVLDHAGRFPDHQAAFSRAERHCDLWVWTADKNRRLFEEGHVRPKSSTTILNGFEPVAVDRGLARSSLGMSEGAVVFTLASRAIEEKGWLAARQAFEALLDEEGRPDVHLLLIGDGPVVGVAKERAPPQVHFVPHTGRLADYIAVSSVGLLPSWFAGESLPLVVIEFLAQGKPLIVSDIGMCPLAIDAGPELGAAGTVLTRRAEDGQVVVGDLKAAMRRFVLEPSLARSLEATAKAAFSKFEFARMMRDYRKALADLLPERAAPGSSQDEPDPASTPRGSSEGSGRPSTAQASA